jgi:hypothetical protein
VPALSLSRSFRIVAPRGFGPARRKVWAALVAAWALLTLLTDVFHAGHLLMVRHVSCPYDGALVHESDLTAQARKASKPVRGAPASLLPQHEHEHCDSLFISHHHATLLAGSERFDATAILAQAGIAERSRQVGAAVLSYAPKLSPPSSC